MFHFRLAAEGLRVLSGRVDPGMKSSSAQGRADRLKTLGVTRSADSDRSAV